MANHDDFEANPYASPEADLTADPEMPIPGTCVYASFWQRFVAAFVDNILTYVMIILISVVAGFVLALAQMGDVGGLVGGLIGIVVPWLYFALQESSDAEATLGKRAMGLRVTDLSGQRISFGRATARYFGKIISGVTLLAGYLMQPFTEKKQAFHDMMSGCLVIKGSA